MNEDKPYKYMAKWVIVPLQNGEKRPVNGLKEWQNLTHSNMTAEFYSKWHHCENWGLLTGRINGVFVVDIDTKDNGIEYWNKLVSEHSIPKTRIVRTGSGGLHVYFKYEDWMDEFVGTNKVDVDGEKIGIDLKTNKQQVLLDGCIHPTTQKKYILEQNIEVSIMPIWLKEFIHKYYKKVDNKAPISNDKKEKVHIEDDIKTDNFDESRYNVIEKLLLLIPHMAIGYDEWSRVGFALHTLPDNDKGLELFDMFSKLGKDKYDQKGVYKQWYSIKDNKDNITWKSIYYWARETNRVEYYQIIGKPINTSSTFGTMSWYEFVKKYNTTPKTYILARHPVGEKAKKKFDKYVLLSTFINDASKCVGYVALAKPLIVVKENNKIDYLESKSFQSKGVGTSVYCPSVDDVEEGKTGHAKTLANIILDNTAAYTYKGIICYPGIYKDKEIINVFNPLPVKLIDNITDENIGIRAVKSHILNILCTGNSDMYEYVCKWISYLLKVPKKLGVMLLFYGASGIGKTRFFAKLAKYILGINNSISVAGFESLMDKFDGYYADKRLVIVQEGSRSDYKDLYKLKNVLTEKQLTIERKGVDKVPIKSYHCYVGFTNHHTINALKEDGMARRIAVIECIKEDEIKNHKNILTQDYHKNLGKLMKEHASEIYTWFTSFDVENWNPEESIPKSMIKESNLKSFSTNSVIEFIIENHDLIISGIRASECKKKYKEWCIEKYIKNPINDKHFILESNGLLNSKRATSGIDKGCIIYSIDEEKYRKYMS